MSNNLFIKVKSTGRVVEVNRSTAGEMVALGAAEYSTAEALAAQNEPKTVEKKAATK